MTLTRFDNNLLNFLGNSILGEPDFSRVIGENWYGRFDATRSSSSLRPFHSHRSSACTMINLTCRSHVSPREKARLRMDAKCVSTSHSRQVDRTVHNFGSPLSSIQRSRNVLSVRYWNPRASCTIDMYVGWVGWWRIYICLHL